MNTTPSLGISSVHVTNNFNFAKFFLIALMLFSIGFSAGYIIVDLEPALDISRFASYNATATFADFFPIEVNVTIAAINGQGGTCWDYYANGTCGSEILEFEMTNHSGIWKKVVFPDYIYPEMYFATSEITWFNVPLNITTFRANYHMLNFTNSFQMESNMSFWIEFNAQAIELNPPQSQDIQIYLVDRNRDLTYFQTDWRTKAGVELVGTKSYADAYHHTHTSNSSHYLIALTTNADGTIGTKNLNISDNFWIILYTPAPNTNKAWNLKYHNSTLCNNTEGWYTGSISGWTTTAQEGCPDVHIHVARRNDYNDGVNLTITSINSSDDILTNYSEFYFGELPNLAPNPSAFLTPENGTFSGTINISWAPATDPNGDNLTYNLTLRNLDGSLNQTLNFTNTTSYEWDSTTVEDDDYDLMIEVCDQEPLCVNFSHSGSFDNFTIDNNPPQFTTIPDNESIVYGTNWAGVTFIAEDVSLIDYFVNDTDNFIINSSGYLNVTKQLAVGTYYVNVSVNDTLGYVNSTIYNLNVTKATPFVTYLLNGVEANVSVIYPNTINASASTDGGTLFIYRNGSDVTSENNQNVLLGVGYYGYEFNVTGNENYTDVSSVFLYAEVNKSESSCLVLFNASSPLTYGTEFEVYSDCDSAFTLYRNGSSISNNSVQSLGAGDYNFTVIRTDTQNYTNVTDEKTFTINKATPTLTYLLNGLQNNASVIYPNTINASASTDYGTLFIYRNGSDVTAQNNLYQDLSVGDYRFDFNVTGNENYTDTSATLYGNVTINNSVCDIVFNTSSPITYPNEFEVSTNCTTDYTLLRNGTDIGAGGIQSLAAGTYNFTVVRTDQQNYSNVVDQEDFTINKATPILNYYLNGVTNNVTVVYPNQINASSSVDHGTLAIYLNGSDVTAQNNLYQDLSVGDYRFDFNVTGNENYTDTSATLYGNVTINNSVCDVLFNETSGLTYGQNFTVYSDCDTAFTLYRNGSVITNNSVQSLAAGTYNFTVVRTDNENYSNVVDQEDFTINKAQSIVETYVKETRGNITINKGNTINLNGTLILGEGPIKLYLNGTLINEGVSPLSNSTLFNFLGTFNVSTIYEETENYTASNETWAIKVIIPSRSSSKDDPKFNYTFDCESGLLEIESEDDLEIRLMSLVDFSTYKNTTNNSGKVSFTLARDGNYRIFTESTSDYHSTTRDVVFEFCKEEIIIPEINETNDTNETEIIIPDVNETEINVTELENLIDLVESELQDAIDENKEVNEAQIKLQQARDAFNRGEYDLAERLANEALILVLNAEAQQPAIDDEPIDGEVIEPEQEEKQDLTIPCIVSFILVLILIWFGFKYMKKQKN